MLQDYFICMYFVNCKYELFFFLSSNLMLIVEAACHNGKSCSLESSYFSLATGQRSDLGQLVQPEPQKSRNNNSSCVRM